MRQWIVRVDGEVVARSWSQKKAEDVVAAWMLSGAEVVVYVKQTAERELYRVKAERVPT